jgi:uncharacterized membrane protein
VLEKILLLILEEHRGKALGVFLGLVASILFLTYGFWRALFIIFFIGIGYYLGKRIDENKNIDNWFKNLFSREKE